MVLERSRKPRTLRHAQIAQKRIDLKAQEVQIGIAAPLRCRVYPDPRVAQRLESASRRCDADTLQAGCREQQVAEVLDSEGDSILRCHVEGDVYGQAVAPLAETGVVEPAGRFSYAWSRRVFHNDDFEVVFAVLPPAHASGLVESAVDGVCVDMTLVLAYFLGVVLLMVFPIDADVVAEGHNDLGGGKCEVVDAVEDLLRQGEEGTLTMLRSVIGISMYWTLHLRGGGLLLCHLDLANVGVGEVALNSYAKRRRRVRIVK